MQSKNYGGNRLAYKVTKNKKPINFTKLQICDGFHKHKHTDYTKMQKKRSQIGLNE